MLDVFFNALSAVSSQLLPILGVAALVLLIMGLSELLKTLKKLNISLEKSHTTLDLTNKSIDKIQAPLNTVVKYSGTLDRAHDTGSKVVTQAKEYVINNTDVLKEKLHKLRNNKDIEKAKKEPSPEDLIGG